MTTNGKMTPASIKITCPATWELQHWDTYLDGQTAYREEQEAAGKTRFSVLTMRFFGAMALFDAGFVAIDAPDQVLSLLKVSNRKRLPVQIANEIGKQIGGAIEAAVDAPLPDYLKVSSDTTKIPNDTPIPVPFETSTA